LSWLTLRSLHWESTVWSVAESFYLSPKGNLCSLNCPHYWVAQLHFANWEWARKALATYKRGNRRGYHPLRLLQSACKLKNIYFCDSDKLILRTSKMHKQYNEKWSMLPRYLTPHLQGGWRQWWSPSALVSNISHFLSQSMSDYTLAKPKRKASKIAARVQLASHGGAFQCIFFPWHNISFCLLPQNYHSAVRNNQGYYTSSARLQ
jgi:hypothetical protein